MAMMGSEGVPIRPFGDRLRNGRLVVAIGQREEGIAIGACRDMRIFGDCLLSELRRPCGAATRRLKFRGGMVRPVETRPQGDFIRLLRFVQVLVQPRPADARYVNQLEAQCKGLLERG